MASLLKSPSVRALTIVLVLQAVLFYSASHGDSKPTSPLTNFPQNFGNWTMLSQGVVDADTLGVLKADDVLTRFYVPAQAGLLNPTPDQRANMMGRAEELFIAYFASQQQGQSPHSPKNCLPGAGWESVDTGEITLPIAGSAPITINKYVIAKGENQSLVLYWYQSHGRVVANEFAAKFYLIADSLRYHRSDTALVRVVAPVLHDDLAGALDGATSFAQAAYPVVYNYLPQ